MPRNAHERRGTSTWHKGAPADLSDDELREIIAELRANEHSHKYKKGRQAIRRGREQYEAELASREQSAQ